MPSPGRRVSSRRIQKDECVPIREIPPAFNAARVRYQRLSAPEDRLAGRELHLHEPTGDRDELDALVDESGGRRLPGAEPQDVSTVELRFGDLSSQMLAAAEETDADEIVLAEPRGLFRRGADVRVVSRRRAGRPTRGLALVA